MNIVQIAVSNSRPNNKKIPSVLHKIVPRSIKRFCGVQGRFSRKEPLVEVK